MERRNNSQFKLIEIERQTKMKTKSDQHGNNQKVGGHEKRDKLHASTSEQRRFSLNTNIRLDCSLQSEEKKSNKIVRRRYADEMNLHSNSFIYSSSSDDENDEDEERMSNKSSNESVVVHKLECISLSGSRELPEFVKHIKRPRRLTFGEIRSLNVSEKFVNEAHKMVFYPPNLAFAPKI